MKSGGSAVIGDLIPGPMSSGGDQSTEPCASAAPGITTKPLVPIGCKASWQSPWVHGVSLIVKVRPVRGFVLQE